MKLGGGGDPASVDHNTTSEADAGKWERAHAPEPPWPRSFEPPRGWSVYDEYPEMSDVTP